MKMVEMLKPEFILEVVKDAAVCREKVGRRIVVHGVLVQVSGIGVLMMGDSGIGKTACGLDLVARGGLWIADDVVVLEARRGALYGRGHERTKRLIAIRGRGILEARSLLGTGALCDQTQVHVIIQFVRYFCREGADPGNERRSFLEIAGIPLPCRRVAIDGGSRWMANEVIGLVNECIVWEKRGYPAGFTHDEADARGNHYGAVRFR
jgi:serine kinase of HPr protein (carbohydrate metabolism regulator)